MLPEASLNALSKPRYLRRSEMCLYLDDPLHRLDHEGRPQALFSDSHSLLQESIGKIGRFEE